MPSNTTFQGVSKASAGYKLLKHFGWNEGEGLGADKQGIQQHVKVKFKIDNKGVGLDTKQQEQQDFSLHMATFDSVLKNLAVTKTTNSKQSLKKQKMSLKAQKKNKSKPEADRIKELENNENGSSGDQKGAVKDKKRLKSSSTKKRKASKETLDGGDTKSGGMSPTASDNSQQSTQETSKATHLRRYKRQKTSKQVSGYSNVDLQAILGGFTSAPAVNPVVNPLKRSHLGASNGANHATSSPSDSQSSESEQDSDETQQNFQEVSEQLQKKKRNVSKTGPKSTSEGVPHSVIVEPQNQRKPTIIIPKIDSSASIVEPVPNPVSTEDDKNKWWSSLFIRASKVKQTTFNYQPAAKVRIHGFLEEDQELLFNKTQDGCSKGRKGLGTSDGLYKIGGVECGVKSKFFESDDEENEQEIKQNQEQGRTLQDQIDSINGLGEEQMIYKYQQAATVVIDKGKGKMKKSKFVKAVALSCGLEYIKSEHYKPIKRAAKLAGLVIQSGHVISNDIS